MITTKKKTVSRKKSKTISKSRSRKNFNKNQKHGSRTMKKMRGGSFRADLPKKFGGESQAPSRLTRAKLGETVVKRQMRGYSNPQTGVNAYEGTSRPVLGHKVLGFSSEANPGGQKPGVITYNSSRGKPSYNTGQQGMTKEQFSALYADPQKLQQLKPKEKIYEQIQFVGQ